MKVKSLTIRNFKAIESVDDLELGPVTVLLGPNNSGKSSLLKAIFQCQSGSHDPLSDLRQGASEGIVELTFDGTHSDPSWGQHGSLNNAMMRVKFQQGGSVSFSSRSQSHLEQPCSPFQGQAPRHFVVPYFSRRKAMNYAEDIRVQYAQNVYPDHTYLAAKLAMIGMSSHPQNATYMKACREILGFEVTAIQSTNGMLPGAYMSDGSILRVNQMGEGVPNIVGLLADLVISKEKLFLIEEPENDLHPGALKALLNLVVHSSTKNQFVVSTHSNIVLRYLGARPESKVYQVRSPFGVLPSKAEFTLVPPTPEARIGALSELGYDLMDFELWEGWLLLEESSAERIIRDYLVPWFAPSLTRVRTVACKGVDKVKPSFEDFYRLTRYAHLEELYRERAWVVVDGDARGLEIVDELRRSFPSWPADRFHPLSASAFENYYPAEFSAKTKQVLEIEDKRSRRDAKAQLLDEVRAWLDADQARGIAALEISASEVIGLLRDIEAAISK